MLHTEYVSQRTADLARFRAAYGEPNDQVTDLCSVSAKTEKLAFYIKKRASEIVERELSWAESDLLAVLLWSAAYKLAANITELEDRMIDILKITSPEDRECVRQEIELIMSSARVLL